jgi:hypothetical protein
METSATWLKLAAHARRIANDMRDPYSVTLMREIAARYEALAKHAGRLGRHRGGLDHNPSLSPPGQPLNLNATTSHPPGCT